MDKKTLKAKHKRVQYNKQSDSKNKKLNKKKPVKKTVKNKKKVVKRNRKRKIVMSDLYSIINKVQLGKKRVTFATSIADAPVMENTIKDAEISYDKVEMRTQVVFTLLPNEKELREDSILDHLEVFEDENPDVDLLFP